MDRTQLAHLMAQIVYFMCVKADVIIRIMFEIYYDLVGDKFILFIKDDMVKVRRIFKEIISVID